MSTSRISPSTSNSSTRRVLIVEDNFINRVVAEEILKAMGYEYDCADNGKAAVELYEDNRYDLILMDCYMPQMDGFEATERIRSYEQKDSLPRTPILAFTGKLNSKEVTRCKNTGFDDILLKPFTEHELKHKLAQWMDFFEKDHQSKASEEHETEEIPPILDLTRFEKFNKLMGEKTEKILDQFTRMGREKIAEMGTAVLNRDEDQVFARAHMLKSTMGQVGATRAAKHMLKMVDLTRNEDYPDFIKIQKEYEQASTAFEESLKLIEEAVSKKHAAKEELAKVE